MRKKYLGIFLFFIFVGTFFNTNINASMNEIFRESLSGIKEYAIIVETNYEGYKEDLRPKPLGEDQLSDLVRINLAANEINIAADDPANDLMLEIPILFVKVTINDNLGQKEMDKAVRYTCNIQLLVFQLVRLERDNSISTIAVTWQSETIFQGGILYVNKGLEDHISYCIKNFVKEHNTANHIK